jgi:hypothetical protein
LPLLKGPTSEAERRGARADHEEAMMRRTLLAAAIGVALGVGGFSLGSHSDYGQETVTKLSERDVIEKLDGK